MTIDTHTPHVEPAWAEAFLLELLAERGWTGWTRLERIEPA